VRTLIAGTSRSSVRRKELPGLVAKRGPGVAALTIALALSLGGLSLAQAPVPERVSGGAAEAPGVAPERITDHSVPAASASAEPEPAVAPAAAVAPSTSSGDGLGAFVIVLLCVGGAVALGVAAYTARRAMHHPAGPAG
jgi:hypothetical protein